MAIASLKSNMCKTYKDDPLTLMNRDCSLLIKSDRYQWKSYTMQHKYLKGDAEDKITPATLKHFHVSYWYIELETFSLYVG